MDIDLAGKCQQIDFVQDWGRKNKSNNHGTSQRFRTTFICSQTLDRLITLTDHAKDLWLSKPWQAINTSYTSCECFYDGQNLHIIYDDRYSLAH